MNAWEIIGLYATIIVSALIISGKNFLSGFGSRKGANLADRQDIALILDNLREQRHEDMKRETALDIMKVYGNLLEASYDIFKATDARPQRLIGREFVDVDQEKHEAVWNAASDKFQRQLTKLWELEEISRLIFPENICNQVTALKRVFLDVRAGTYEDSAKFFALNEDLRKEQEKLSKMIRAELQI